MAICGLKACATGAAPESADASIWAIALTPFFCARIEWSFAEHATKVASGL
jgi:hypothetical protein